MSHCRRKISVATIRDWKEILFLYVWHHIMDFHLCHSLCISVWIWQFKHNKTWKKACHVTAAFCACALDMYTNRCFSRVSEVRAVKAQPYSGKECSEQQLICVWIDMHKKSVSASIQNRHFRKDIIIDLWGILGTYDTYITYCKKAHEGLL